MNTLDLNEAVSFLKMNPEVLRRKARAGQVPGRKAGKCWHLLKNILQIGCLGAILNLGYKIKVIDESNTRG